ncbi:MAG: hypothetical protein IPL47_07740 [Phyllobacteriaceae bacterium]|nr:hypothetical protein [Phyllobacteriaceae bacterium]
MTPSNRLRMAAPSAKLALGGGLAWGATMALIVGVSFLLRGWSEPAAIAKVASLFFFGGAIAFAPAGYFARLFGRRRFEPSFAMAFIGLAAFSLGGGGGVQRTGVP